MKQVTLVDVVISDLFLWPHDLDALRGNHPTGIVAVKHQSRQRGGAASRQEHIQLPGRDEQLVINGDREQTELVRSSALNEEGLDQRDDARHAATPQIVQVTCRRCAAQELKEEHLRLSAACDAVLLLDVVGLPQRGDGDGRGLSLRALGIWDEIEADGNHVVVKKGPRKEPLINPNIPKAALRPSGDTFVRIARDREAGSSVRRARGRLLRHHHDTKHARQECKMEHSRLECRSTINGKVQRPAR
eukprot:scaffold145_cov261-Pinguiococcus_pyrenoidosus.AAC.10